MISKSIRPAIAAFLLTLLFMGITAPFDLGNMPHEGVLFKPAIDILEGKMLFRDSFTQYGAVPILLQALAIKVFGRYLIVPKLFTVIFYAFIALLLFLIWSRFIPRWLALTGIIAWNLLTHHFYDSFLPWSSVYALFFLALSAYLGLLFLEKGKASFLFIAGASTALSFLSKQNVGMATFLSELVFFAFLPLLSFQGKTKGLWKSPLILFAGFLSAFSLFFAWITFNGAVHAWWLQSFVWPFNFARIYGDSYSRQGILKCLFPVGQLGGWHNIFVLMPVSCLIFCGIMLFKISKRSFTFSDVRFTLLLAVSLASWLQYYPIQGACYFWWASAPMVGILLRSLYDGVSFLFKRSRVSSPRLITATVLVLFAGMMVQHMCERIEFLSKRLKQEFVFVGKESFFKGLVLPRSKADHVLKVEDAINFTVNARQPEGGQPDVLLDGLEAAHLCMVKNVKLFHPMWMSYEPAYRAIYPNYRQLANAHIVNDKPIIFTNSGEFFKYRLLYTDVYQFILANYIFLKVDDDFVILMPK